MNLLAALVLAAAATTPAPAAEKKEEKPRPSPAATVTQVVGLTKITVEYSSPAVRGRQIYGGQVVPYGQVWRTGANEATRITFSNEVQVAGTSLPAGTYGLFSIPGEKAWTFILSKDAKQWGAYEYKQADDVARVPAGAPEAIPPRERLVFIFSNTTDDGSTRLDLEWEKTRVSLPIKVSK
jgi:hypothetical protein